ncbi:hypothetical protein [Kitasatospora sp. NPDC057198]|uniref:hypothetical protein n=1 Tax=Kitasatospora sp. NPDC057198 TaxID=3346046 RepID=UPI003633148A
MRDPAGGRRRGGAGVLLLVGLVGFGLCLSLDAVPPLRREAFVTALTVSLRRFLSSR